MIKKHRRYVYFGILIVCFFLYGNSLNNDYSLDDEYVIAGNPLVENGIKGIPKIFRSHYINKGIEKHSYRPVTLTTFAIEYELFEVNPKASHLINVLLYALTCMLLFKLLLRLFREYHWSLTVLTVLLFLVIPVHSEAVNNVKSRDELLSFFFALLSLYQFVKYADKGKLLSVFLGLLFICLSLLSKLSSFTFLAIIPLTLWFFTEMKLKKLLIITGGMAAFLIGMRYGVMDLLSSESSIRENVFFENPLYFSELGLIGKIPMAVFTSAYYLKLLVFPKTLLCYYGYNQVPIVGWGDPYFWISAALVLPVLVYAFWKLRTKSVLVYGILFFFIAISLFSNLVKPAVGIIAERFAYIPSLGFCIAVAYLLLKVFKAKIKNSEEKFTMQYKGAFFGVLAIVFVASCARVVTRTKDWKDKETLLRHDAELAPNSAKLNSILGHHLFKEARTASNPATKQAIGKESVHYFRRSLDVFPGYEIGWNNLAGVYFNVLQDFESAKECFEKAIELKPEYDTALFGLGYYYELKKEYAKALELYQKVLEITPDEPRVHQHIAAVRAAMPQDQ